MSDKYVSKKWLKELNRKSSRIEFEGVNWKWSLLTKKNKLLSIVKKIG